MFYLPIMVITFIYYCSSTSSSESPSPPLPSQHIVSSMSSSPITTPITIATSTSSGSTLTSLEESSPRHFQHPSPRSQQQLLGVSKVNSCFYIKSVTFFCPSVAIFNCPFIVCFFLYFVVACCTGANSSPSDRCKGDLHH